MTQRVLGPTGSRRRRRFYFGPILLVAALALMFTPGAQAVHDLGLFELDRNAQDAGGTSGDDWATLYAGGANTGGSSDDFTGVLADVALPGTQFQGGGSKDDLDITQWLWKAGEPLDKDDITNAYAAAYTNTVDSGENDIGDLIIYYGLDRFSAAGSAQVGFWFLQDPNFGLSQTSSGGGFQFSGAHQDNDVLVQVNFSGGGVIDTFTVYKWLGGSLVQVANAVDCLGPPVAANDDPVCGTVNRAPFASPWPYVPKANEGSPGTFLTGAFFEGGINISRLIPAAGCFNKFLAETRSSTPFDARLKDFVTGDLDTCVRDVRVVKTPDDGTANAGDTITFSINVKNIGNVAADNVTLNDNLPNSTLNWSIASQPAGAPCSISGAVGSQVLSCNFGTLAVNAERDVTISSPTTSASCGAKPNTVTVSATGDIDTSNNSDNGQITVNCPDVSVVKTPDGEAGPPGTIPSGSNATFTMTVTNNGPGSASNVTLGDNLPNSGLNWSESSDPANACTVSGAVGSQVLSCNFGTLPQGATRSVSVTSPTTAANCGTISNTVTISATGDINAANNSDNGSIVVECAAIRILKNSTKGGAVSTAGAVFSITGPGISGSLSVTDDATAAAPDEDADVGEVCVSGLQPGGNYIVNETSPPNGYGGAGEANVVVVAVAGGCSTAGLNAATFSNPPLADIQVNFRDGGSGETSATIECVRNSIVLTPDSTTPPAGWDSSQTHEDLEPDTYVCTVVIDP
jgi:uncharacterized repeat protein (TIGR01451 family)